MKIFTPNFDPGARVGFFFSATVFIVTTVRYAQLTNGDSTYVYSLEGQTEFFSEDDLYEIPDGKNVLVKLVEQ